MHAEKHRNEHAEALLKRREEKIKARQKSLETFESRVARREREVKAQQQIVERNLSISEKRFTAAAAAKESASRELASARRSRKAADRRQAKQQEAEKKLKDRSKKLDVRKRQLAKLDTTLKRKEKKLEQLEKSARAAQAKGAKTPRTRKKVEFEPTNIQNLIEWAGSALGASELWPHSEPVVVVGDGPYSNHELKSHLKGQQFTIARPGDADARIMIVGRQKWTETTLERQIKARQGDELRVYSQEMFLLATAVSRDPLDECDPRELVSLFASEHPALQFLIASGFEWPNVGLESLPNKPRGDWGVEESPLHLMGYHVGKTSALTERERRAILKRAFSGPLKIVPNEEYMAEWGYQSTERRLWRMAHHVALLASTQGRGKKIAGSHWAQDLRWMKKNLFEPWMKFKWPDTNVPGK